MQHKPDAAFDLMHVSQVDELFDKLFVGSNPTDSDEADPGPGPAPSASLLPTRTPQSPNLAAGVPGGTSTETPAAVDP